MSFIICGNGWGLGINVLRDEDGNEELCYGFPCVENPNDFSPDPESCTPEEITTHDAAVKAWNLAHGGRP